MLRSVATFGLIAFTVCMTRSAQGQRDEAAVRKPVYAFVAAFNAGFVGPADFASDDWAHINPSGGWTRGRENVLKEVRAVHSTFLKGVILTIEKIEVRFAGPDAAVATVISTATPFTTPDGVKHDHERGIETFVVARRAGRWLVIQDQSTRIIPPE